MPFFAEKKADSGRRHAAFLKPLLRTGLRLSGLSMPDTTCIIFAESQVDKRNRRVQKGKGAGYAAEMQRQMRLSLPVGPVEFCHREERKMTGRTNGYCF